MTRDAQTLSISPTHTHALLLCDEGNQKISLKFHAFE